MRVIAGRFRGRHLVSFSASHLRPTTDRTKESIFNKLMGELPESRVLDLFAGTGSLSIEALSRGAAKVVSVEKNKKSLRIMDQNLDLLKISKSEIEVHRGDVFRFLPTYDGPPFDIVLIDPPFTQKLADETMVALAQSRAIAKGTTVVLESSSFESLADSYPSLKLLERKDFGDKVLSIFHGLD